MGKDYYGGVSIRTKLGPARSTNIVGDDAIFENTGRGSGDILAEDAEFIVRACNSHDDLLAAGEALSDLSAWCDANLNGDLRCSAAGVLEQAKTALATRGQP